MNHSKKLVLALAVAIGLHVVHVIVEVGVALQATPATIALAGIPAAVGAPSAVLSVIKHWSLVNHRKKLVLVLAVAIGLHVVHVIVEVGVALQATPATIALAGIVAAVGAPSAVLTLIEHWTS
ncbi:hypothetical protein SMC26_40325 [Actinomadura fulvescens]|uniref:Uncharacterized protein n=1 Tax=Actinomadura fulvescens TaxID=46160 RepID=A0ABP6CFV2_9ACTN